MVTWYLIALSTAPPHHHHHLSLTPITRLDIRAAPEANEYLLHINEGFILTNLLLLSSVMKCGNIYTLNHLSFVIAVLCHKWLAAGVGQNL